MATASGVTVRRKTVYAVIGASVWIFTEEKYHELLEAIVDGKPITYTNYGVEAGKYVGDITYIDKFRARQELERG
jgi:hypothetical protein